LEIISEKIILPAITICTKQYISRARLYRYSYFNIKNDFYISKQNFFDAEKDNSDFDEEKYGIYFEKEFYENYSNKIRNDFSADKIGLTLR
jgi:hypothetical protein